VVGCEGYMVCRMPVFGADFEREGEAEEVVDCWDYGAAIGDGKGAGLCQYCLSNVVVGAREEWNGVVGLTGGQKSSCTSTTMRAGLKLVAMMSVRDCDGDMMSGTYGSNSAALIVVVVALSLLMRLLNVFSRTLFIRATK
jgi:hypothetical protein